jgi:hypothetical protein
VFHRFAIRLTLACYSVIALFGQGLHALAHGHRCNGCQVATVAVGVEGQKQPIVADADDDTAHDAEHCSICQYHSLGQILVAAPPVENPLAVCEPVSSFAPQLIVCPALYAVSQPRAPPSV